MLQSDRGPEPTHGRAFVWAFVITQVVFIYYMSLCCLNSPRIILRVTLGTHPPYTLTNSTGADTHTEDFKEWVNFFCSSHYYCVTLKSGSVDCLVLSIPIALQLKLGTSQFRYYVDVLFMEVCVLVFEMVIMFSHISLPELRPGMFASSMFLVFVGFNFFLLSKRPCWLTRGTN